MAILRSVCIAVNDVKVRQLSFGLEKANTYMIESGGHAILIDICSSDAVKEIRDVIPDYIILTHEHCDHLWGLNTLRERFPNINVIAQEKCSEAITDPRSNKAKQYRIYAVLRFGENYKNNEAENRTYCCNPADIVFDDWYHFAWNGMEIELSHAPGHSPGSAIIRVSGIGFFTGDSMILEENTFLKFDDGNVAEYINITQRLIEAIPVDAYIFPGHGGIFKKKDWIRKRTGNGKLIKG